MRVKIVDNAPGSGPARRTYLEARLRRVLAPFQRRITTAELKLEFDGVFYDGVLMLRLPKEAPLAFSTKGRRMTMVLANIIDAGEERLATVFPSAKVREAAV